MKLILLTFLSLICVLIINNNFINGTTEEGKVYLKNKSNENGLIYILNKLLLIIMYKYYVLILYIDIIYYYYTLIRSNYLTKRFNV